MTDTRDAAHATSAAPRRQLTLLDGICIIVGIIIGTGIYQSSPDVAACVPGPWWLVGVWVAGGLASFIGALCYAELATAYPREGGDYVYLTRAFGRPVGFLFAWAQLWVVRPGSVGAWAFIFAAYANEILPLGDGAATLIVWAAGAIVVLTVINILGVRAGKWTQNVLTIIKVLGLAAIVIVGLAVSPPPDAAAGAASTVPAAAGPFNWMGLYLALIFVLYTYGGWNEMAYVGAEVRDPSRNILRSLMLGTAAVTLIYVLVTLAFMHALGFEGLGASKAVAADVLRRGLGPWGGRAISLLICLSALGAINGMVFTGARITYAMGTEHRLYAWLGRWNARRGTPIVSLVAQAAVTLALVVGFGLTATGFESMVKFTTPVFWVFFLLVGVSLFVLRVREPATVRPFRVPLYPVVPLVFCATSAFMLYGSVTYAWAMRSNEALWSIGILAVGLVLALVDRRPMPAAR
jgi:amino acid transporter